MCKINGNGTTLENIHRAAKAEFLEKGYKDASLRNIVKSVGMTTGAFYGYYKSKEELFEAIVGEHYEYIRNRFIKAQQEFAELPAAQQPEVMSDISGLCMYDMLHYAYEHLEECKLILCCSEGTKFAGLIDEMVEIEVDGTHAYQDADHLFLGRQFFYIIDQAREGDNPSRCIKGAHFSDVVFGIFERHFVDDQFKKGMKHSGDQNMLQRRIDMRRGPSKLP